MAGDYLRGTQIDVGGVGENLERIGKLMQEESMPLKEIQATHTTGSDEYTMLELTIKYPIPDSERDLAEPIEYND